MHQRYGLTLSLLTSLLVACGQMTSPVISSPVTNVPSTPAPVPVPIPTPTPLPTPTPAPTPAPAPIPTLAAQKTTFIGNIGALTSSTPTVQVVDQSGQPLANIEVQWVVTGGTGWVYPIGKTDIHGYARANWILGPESAQSLQASVTGTAPVNMSAQATTFTTQANSVHLYSFTAPATDYKIAVQPLQEATPTYFAAANVQDGYFGVQRTGAGTAGLLIFSVWDAAGPATVISAGTTDGCIDFGNEGTGKSCRKAVQWTDGETFTFELGVVPVGNDADMTVYATRSSTGERIHMGTLRHAGPVTLTSAAAFVEDYGQPSSNCLSTGARKTRVSPLQAKIGGTWQTINTASFDSYYPRTRCGNILFGKQDGWFLLGTGGRLVSDPAITTLTLP